MTDQKHLVLIESGSNQEFIFRSNRQRYAVGASQLLKQLPGVVDSVVKRVATTTSAPSGIEVIVNMSGKALLLVPTREIGRDVVARVTRDMLNTAPGMDVWGCVEQKIDGSATFGARVAAIHRDHAAARSSRPSPQLRWPQRPFLDQCVTTGLPATGLADPPGSSRPGARAAARPAQVTASASAATVLSAAATARTAFASLGDAVLGDLSEEIRNAGWVAVVHADGNGIGSIIATIDNPATLTSFSAALEEVTQAAFAEAVQGMTATDPHDPPPTEWIVPLIIGGDDITVVCDARYAVDFTRAYLRAFETKAAAEPRITTCLRESGQRVTAAAGIAAVKTRYPFMAAYDLAEDLVRSVKAELKTHSRGRSAYDVHVLHDSVDRPLHEIRSASCSSWGTGSRARTQRLFAGPLLIPSPMSSTVSNTDPQLPLSVSTWELAHDDSEVVAARDALCGPRESRPLNGSAWHRLRAAYLAGGAEPERVEQEIVLRARDRAATEDLLDRHTRVNDGRHQLTHLLTIFDLVDIRQGRAEGERPSGSAGRKGATL